MARTPRWWRALPTWTQVLWLSTWLPGVVAHELTHALAAEPWASSTLDFDAVACRFEWDGDHYLARAVAYIAPLVVGSALTVGLVLTVAGQPGTVVPLAVLAYIVINLALYTVASVADLLGALTWVARWWQGRAAGTAPLVEQEDV